MTAQRRVIHFDGKSAMLRLAPNSVRGDYFFRISRCLPIFRIVHGKQSYRTMAIFVLASAGEIPEFQLGRALLRSLL